MGSRAIMSVFILILTCLALTLPSNLDARFNMEKPYQKDTETPKRVMVLDGSNVHNVGQLYMHVGNWGMFGSMPSSSMPFSHAPSAEWPGGSGVEHLYVAGLWVGALKSGVPAVSTAAHEWEFRPTDDPIDIIYQSARGAVGGNRLPSAFADDDDDGLMDEDWLDGHDNDLDGLIDEDFAAISNQMFSCWYTDNQPAAIQAYPEHEPLDLMVRQESYQWSSSDFDDFVGVEFTITNIGTEVLENIHVGLFVDPDVGPRDQPNYWEDDASGFLRFDPICSDYGPAPVDVAYSYDIDGDEGLSPGYFGVMFLGHPTDPTGELAPRRVGASTYASFAGEQSYEEGGDPTNDFERYELMSMQTIERDHTVPRDYRILISTGPFAELLPGSSLVVQAAFAVGAGLDVITNAAHARITYNGAWYDIDEDPLTGIDRRETPIMGPVHGVVIDSCRAEYSDPIDWPYHSYIWINNDCAQEDFFKAECQYSEADSFYFRTGVGGRERHIHWIPGDESPIPVQVTGFEATAVDAGVELAWDISSDEDIKGFKIYRRPDGETAYMDINSGRLIPAGERKFIDRSIRAGMTYQYMLGVVKENNSEVRSQIVTVISKAAFLMLFHNYPNPFNPSTTVSFTLPEPANVNLSIYDIEGKLVKTLLNEKATKGFNKVTWDGSDKNGTPVASGIYYVRLRSAGKVLTNKMMLLR